ncbi:ankyrin repeat domain-containing protein [Streptosporangium lutulentum]
MTVGDDEWAEDIGAWRDSNLAQIRERLADGLDPGQLLPWLRSTPLHQAAQEGAVQVIELLLDSGAAVDPIDGDGATPLWEAVRHGQDAAVQALLDAGADPWRPCIAGRSPGVQAMFTELADLFVHLPGAPRVSPRLRELQDTVDEMMFSYETYNEDLCVAFVGGVDEDEIIRRLGAAPELCPPVDPTELWKAEQSSPSRSCGSPARRGRGRALPERRHPAGARRRRPDGHHRRRDPGRGVPVRQSLGRHLAGRLRRRAALGSRAAQRQQPVRGVDVPFRRPRRAPSTAIERALALMTLLTATYITEEWLWSAPMRLVPVRLLSEGLGR